MSHIGGLYKSNYSHPVTHMYVPHREREKIACIYLSCKPRIKCRVTKSVSFRRRMRTGLTSSPTGLWWGI